jgi:hypothetical protein
MLEAYRKKDQKLRRNVAIKILPEKCVEDVDRENLPCCGSGVSDPDTSAAFRSAPCLLFLEPQERTDTMLCLKFHLKAAAGHNSRIAAPAGFMIQINTVHIKAGADLFDFPFVARQLIVE